MKLTVKLPNFSMTRGRIPDVGRDNAARLRRRRRIRSLLLWGSVVAVFLAVFSWLSLPTRALSWRIEHEAKKVGFVISIEDLSVRPWGTVVLRNVAWTYSPSRPGEVPGKFFLEEVDLSISLMSLLVGNLALELEAELDEGVVRAEYIKRADESEYSFEIEAVPLYGLPKAQQALNAPMRGILAIKGELVLPEHKFADSTGYVEITCASCTIGDGETKLYVPGSKGALANGVTIPEVDLGTLTGRMTVDKGVAQTDGAIETESDDVWVQIEGEVQLTDPFSRSRFDMLLKFNLSETLQDRSEPMKLMIQTASDKSKLEAPEQGLGFKLLGPLSAPRFYGHLTKSRRQSRADKRDSYKKRAEKRRKKSAARKNTSKDADKDADKDTDKARAQDDGEDDAKDDGLDVQPIEPSKAALPPVDEPPSPEEAPPTEEPAEEPAAEEPAAEEPAAEEPAAEEPADDGVVIEEGADEGGQPAEGQGEGEGDGAQDGGGQGDAAQGDSGPAEE